MTDLDATDLDCDEFVELVTAFLDGALDAGTEGRFAGHLASCDGCERYLDQIRQTIRTLGDLPAASPPAEGLPAGSLPAGSLPAGSLPAGSLSAQAREALLAALRTRDG